MLQSNEKQGNYLNLNNKKNLMKASCEKQQISGIASIGDLNGFIVSSHSIGSCCEGKMH